MLIWVEDDRLSDAARAAIEAAEAVYISAATILEAEIKRATGKLRIAADLTAIVDESGFERLPITFEHASEAGRLPLLHGDPFDRMLIAQARIEGLSLVTADPQIHRYSVAVLDADRRP